MQDSRLTFSKVTDDTCISKSQTGLGEISANETVNNVSPMAEAAIQTDNPNMAAAPTTRHHPVCPSRE